MPEWLRNPNSYVIITLLLIMCTALTWVVPAGEFQRVKDPRSGKMVVDPNSFQYVPQKGVSVFGMLKAVPRGISESAGIIAAIFLISGAMGVIKATGAIDKALLFMIQRLKGRDKPLLIATCIAFSLLGATFGFAEETIPFIPIGVSIALALGYDRIVGFDIVRTAAWIGFAGAFLNPYSIGVAQNIAELPLFSGMGFRILCYVVFMAIFLWHSLRYASRVKRNPDASLLKDYAGEGIKFGLSEDHAGNFTTRHTLVLLIMAAAMVALVYGVIKFGWYTTEMAALFLGAGLVCGLLGGLSVNQVAREFTKNMAGVTSGAIVVGFARAMVIVMTDAEILDTIVRGFAGTLMASTPAVAAVGLFAVQSMLNFFIGGSSGLAVATMPIMIPLADLIGMTRQTAVLAFQFGDGITNMFYPAMMYYLVFADIPYSRWVKHNLSLTLYLTAAGAVLVAIAGVIGYGPF